jgi:SAM-dependent methyltransferase
VTRRQRTVRLARRPPGGGSRTRAGQRVYQSPVPPEEDWGPVARLYDLEHPSCRGAELAFWHHLAGAWGPAGSEGSASLELAAGSGRIAVALARKGHRVTGLELSAAMLERARARTARLPAEMRPRLEWVQGDMTRFDLPGRRFGLIFVAYNSFWLLDRERAQEACLRAVARHLAPGGRLVLDVFPPNADDRQSEVGLIQQLPLAWRGRTIMRVKDYAYDEARDVATSDVRYYAASGRPDVPPDVLARFRYHLHLASPEDVQGLLEREGYVVQETLGSYTGDPLLPDSPRAIFVCALRDSEST